VDSIKRAKLQDIVDLTSTACIAGKHIKTMNATDKKLVVDKLAKSAKRNENKTLKAAVLAVTYEAACQAAFVRHLEEQKKEVSEMVHGKRKSIVEEQVFLATIKIGDWVEVESDYSHRLNSDGGIGCVFGLHKDPVLGEFVPRVSALGIHYLIFNRKERGVALSRCVVIPMPFKDDSQFYVCASSKHLF
jgi:hypothetical protein